MLELGPEISTFCLLTPNLGPRPRTSDLGPRISNLEPRAVKLCTAKLCLENQNKIYRDQSYPKAFQQINKRESNFPCSLVQITPDNKQRFNTHSVSLGLEPTNVVGCSVQILFKRDKNQEGLCLNCKRNSEKRSTEDQKLSFGSQTVEIFPNCSNNVRFSTKTSQLSTTKRDECNRSVGCAR